MTILFHRDMGVGAKAKRNGETSTCIGSAVLVVSIGCDQIFSFLKNAGNRDAKARYSHENLARGNDGKYLSFMMKHGSIYVMLPKADQSHYHHCYFPRDNTTDVSTHRVALASRNWSMAMACNCSSHLKPLLHISMLYGSLRTMRPRCKPQWSKTVAVLPLQAILTSIKRKC